MTTIVLDSNGQVVACGGNGLTPAAGQTARDVPLTLDDYRAADVAGEASGQPYEVTYDGKKFGWRQRAKSPQEVDEDARQALIANLQAAADGWGTLTATQKDARLRDVVRGVLRTLQR